MSLFEVLTANYPQAVTPPNGLDFQLGDHGKGAGPEIVAWNAAKLGPQPTPDEIAKWTAEYQPPARRVTPAKLIAAIKSIDPQKAAAIIAATDDLTYAEFITADTVPLDHPKLSEAIAAAGITPEQLVAALS